jgi:integrase
VDLEAPVALLLRLPLGRLVVGADVDRPSATVPTAQRFDRLAAAGLSRSTFHDLRHSCATGALKASVNPKVISERIGHADTGFFLQT